ncbi:J domain-containing protein [Pseudomonas sp. 681]|uniref:J domain-containing protein n=1 Tax=Pseudomonas fungipugnans TaxID=3024217 RepID=A0ABT6QVJ1_9PSED|nr:J domain-containing protein [Pseudomonas sp. 681]MDI2594922.1 J domain-containing protein [Pseudomonas sp. 681]
MSCWIRLGIEPTQDNDAIRSAYRARLPQHHPETDPQGFQALREAYEVALRYAREEDLEETDAGASAADQLLAHFEALLLDSTRRFNPDAWHAFNLELDQQSLETLDEVCWALLRQLLDAGPVSHTCVRLLAQRMGWANRMLDLAFEHARQVDEFLQRIAVPDPFDTSLMTHWPVAAQLESLWYVRTLDYLHRNEPLADFQYFASLHTCVPLPADDALLQRLAVQFTQASIASKSFLELVSEQHRLAPDDVDWLYLLACQRSALGLEELALQAWVRLWLEHQHPKAATWLLELCARHQPLRLPLLIQAFDRLENFRAWSDDLNDVSQEYGSPSQRPETLARWFNARQLDLVGIADAFVEWRINGDELPLLAWLMIEGEDPQLQTLYQHAWALHRGDVPLLQRVMDAPQASDVLDELVLQGFKYQAEQQLCWLTHAPIPLALKAFLDSQAAQPLLAPELQKGEPRELALLWMRRLRPYDVLALTRLDEAFAPGKQGAMLGGVHLQVQLAEQGLLLPAMTADLDVWEWHRQALYLLATLADPQRWLGAQSATCVDAMNIPREHPLARLQPLLRRLNREEGCASGLLGWLQAEDPVHALLARQLLGVQEALDSTKLLGNDRLLACMRSDIRAFDDDLLGRMLLCGVLYQDPLMDAEQRGYLLGRISGVTNPEDWFDKFRDSLIKGEPTRPPRSALEGEGIDSDAFYLALDALKGLARHGGAGVPRRKMLQCMQKAKDYPAHGLGLRFALSALLSWSERLLLAKSDTRPVPSSAFWRLGSRLGRKAFIGQVLGCVLITPVVALLSGTAVSGFAMLLLGVLLLLSATLRRLHDMGRGIPTLLIIGCLTPVLPFLPLLLFGFPGDTLPNRYGVPPDSADQETLPGGLQATLRRLNG